MIVRRIVVPRRFDLTSLRGFLRNDLWRNPAVDRLVIDNSEHEWIEPIGLVSLGAAICNLRLGREEQCSVEFTGSDNLGYLQRMDLWRVTGLEADEGFQRWGSAGRFVELSCISTFGEVDLTSNRLMEVVPDDPELKKVFHHCLTELLNNVFQHAMSEVSPLTCAQVWPQRGTVQIAVADCGIGIRAALAMNPDFHTPDDLAAIALAMRPWTSGRAHLRGPYAEYGTKGNGLFMVRRLVEGVRGRLVTASHVGLRDVRHGSEEGILVGSWPGTVVGVEFPLRLPGDWLTLVRPIWEEIRQAPR